MIRACSIAILLLLSLASSEAHIGSPNIYFGGNAGPYPIRVVVRPPGVVPGLAEINVRVLDGHADRVTALPVYFRAGRKGAPPPDVAERVRGDTNLFTAALWFMESGAYSVDVSVEGAQGKGTVVVPVNSVAMTRNEMQPWFRNMLIFLGALLFAGVVWLSGAAFNDSIVEPGAAPPNRWRRPITMACGGVFFALLLTIGKLWWDKDDREYRNNRLYKPTPMQAEVKDRNGQPILRLAIDFNNPRRSGPLIPDHGKLMHLFAVREPEADVFAHLHPVRQSARIFEAAIPPLPEGKYQLYADITHENGFFETLTAAVQLPPLPESYVALWKLGGRSDVICSSVGASANLTNFAVPPDMDDSWHIAREQSFAERRSRLPGGLSMLWESNLAFRLLSPEGASLPIESYMGMFGHAVVRHKNGSVFAHVHPVGTFSMASQQFFLGTTNTTHTHPTNTVTSVSFPYEFPRPGPYRLWVQLKSNGRVYTGVFETNVQGSTYTGMPISTNFTNNSAFQFASRKQP
jgi:hypothetical protein